LLLIFNWRGIRADLARYMEMGGYMSGRDPGDLSRDFSGRAHGGRDKGRRPAGPKLEL